jgi:hypothetical protein
MEVWQEVQRDIHLDKFISGATTYCLHNGCKIAHSGKRVAIYNCNTGGGTFALVSPRQMQMFLDHGFREGTEYLALDNVKTEVMLLDVQIRRCERTKNVLDLLKLKKRKTLLSNLIKSNYYGNTKEKHV